MRLDTRSTKKNKQGMTLMELMVVIAIIMILMGIVVGISGAAQRGAAEAKAKAEIGQLALELENMRADPNIGRYPTTAEGLQALVSWYTTIRYVGVEWDLTDLNNSNQPIDPWGRPYQFTNQNDLFFTLFSTGPAGPSVPEDNITMRN